MFRFSVAAVLVLALPVYANVFDMPAGLTSLEMVTVGDAGNIADTRLMNDGTTGYGAVGYTYEIGKFEVTAGQYCQFLNAVAKNDAYGLYHPSMADPTPNVLGYGCNIQRTGLPGSYGYSVAADWANRPVNYVSWGDAARFCNWLSNGQPNGEQCLTTTEDGSYYLNGATTWEALMAVSRKSNARYVIPSENEWYKTAFYDPDKPGGAGYWYFTTRSDTTPTNAPSPTGTNNLNCRDAYGTGTSGYTIGDPYYRTEVGTFASSPSPYGTFDQGGNVWEWNEADWFNMRGRRGGSFENSIPDGYFVATFRYGQNPSPDDYYLGFRIALVPEPATLLLLALGGLAVMRIKQRSARLASVDEASTDGTIRLEVLPCGVLLLASGRGYYCHVSGRLC